MRNITKVFITGTNLLMILTPASLLSSCSTKIEVQYIAHRGAPAGFNDAYSRRFENNKESFLSGGEQAKFMGLETDVYKTSDNKWVVVHDDNPFMDSATGNRLAGTYVEEKTFNYCISQQIVPSKAYPS
jgi:glycerophosphoryl diester phosphodiesterase